MFDLRKSLVMCLPEKEFGCVLDLRKILIAVGSEKAFGRVLNLRKSLVFRSVNLMQLIRSYVGIKRKQIGNCRHTVITGLFICRP